MVCCQSNYEFSELIPKIKFDLVVQRITKAIGALIANIFPKSRQIFATCVSIVA